MSWSHRDIHCSIQISPVKTIYNDNITKIDIRYDSCKDVIDAAAVDDDMFIIIIVIVIMTGVGDVIIFAIYVNTMW